MSNLFSESDSINFGELPEEIDDLLQEGVAAYRNDAARANLLFRQALAAAPTQLPIYFCLYKIHTYQGNLDEAEAAAISGLKEAAEQAGWDPDWRQWRPQPTLPEGAGRFALYTLKALAFIYLRQDRQSKAERILATLRQLDPAGTVGWPVVAAFAAGIN
jgi:tetratricopeptide (TPR) repeat protein